MSDDEPVTVFQPKAGPEVRHDEPPTILQRRPDDEEPATTYQGIPTQAMPGAASRLPAELARRFTLVAGPSGNPRLGSGAEADVWLAQDNDSSALVALKVYDRDGAPPFDSALRERLQNDAFAEFVPRIHGWGVVEEGGRTIPWEALEYFPLGSLADLLKQEASTGEGLAPGRAREVTQVLLRALVFWENTVRHRQIDLSPGNVLLRQANPLQLVLSDFGGVKGTGLSQTFGDLQVKVGYMAPEALGNGNHAKSPFWSLGMIVYELLAGHSLFSEHDENAFRMVLATDDIDVSQVRDPRWRLLIEGLLTRNTHYRWGPGEVERWLGNDSPEVHRQVRIGRAAPALEFAGEQFDDPQVLAAALVNAPDDAVAWLRGGGARTLTDWLTANFPDLSLDRTHLTGLQQSDRAYLAVSWIGAAFLTGLRPSYRRSYVDEEGLLQLARDPGSQAFLRHVIDVGVLPIAAEHRCAHKKCQPGGRCLVLDGVGRTVSAASAQVRDRLSRLYTRLSTDQLMPTTFHDPGDVTSMDADLVCARVTELLLAPDAVESLQARIRRTRLPRAAWWRDLARDAAAGDRSAPGALAALVVADHVLDFAATYRQAEDGERRVGSRQRWSNRVRWVKSQFSGTPTGPRRTITVPRWLTGIFLVLIPVASFEPVYLGYALPNGLPRDPEVMSTAYQFTAGLAPYTAWSRDWLTPWLFDRFSTHHWQGLAAYPIVLALCVIVIRRTTRGANPRSWLAVPAVAVGVVFSVGLIMHLAWNETLGIWSSVALMGGGAFVAPVLALIGTRILAGRGRPW